MTLRHSRRIEVTLGTLVALLASVTSPRSGTIVHSHIGGEHAHVHLTELHQDDDTPHHHHHDTEEHEHAHGHDLHQDSDDAHVAHHQHAHQLAHHTGSGPVFEHPEAFAAQHWHSQTYFQHGIAPSPAPITVSQRAAAVVTSRPQVVPCSTPRCAQPRAPPFPLVRA